MTDKHRAIYLLRVAARFIEKHPVKEYTIEYDGTECDGQCLQNDLELAADALAGDAG